MRVRLLFLLVAMSALLAAPTPAQEKKPVNVGHVYVTVVKPGMAQQYEAGRKKHMDWHRSQNDPWTWEIWQVATGEATGAYLSISFNHTWKDFDTWEQKFGAGDTADGAKNLEPYTAVSTDSIWVYLPDVSRPPDTMEPSKMAEVLHFMVKTSAESDFSYDIRKITEAISKTNWPTHYFWYVLINGGEQPHFALVIPHNSWADMAEPEPSFDAMLEKAFGKHEAGALIHDVDKAVQRQWSEIIVYRPDLSYRPAAK